MVQGQNKRQALIDAAVHLIVEKGDSSLASTRAIMTMAHANKLTIDYHFGNKVGLIDAVLDKLRQMHSDECFSAYYNRSRNLLTTHEGNVQFVCGMLDEFQDFFKNNNENYWRTLLRTRVIESYHEVDQSIFTVFIESDVATFYQIFRTITGQDSAAESFSWFMNVMFLLSIRSYRKNKLTFSTTTLELSADFDKFFVDFYKNRLLIGWGLIEMSADNSRVAVTLIKKKIINNMQKIILYLEFPSFRFIYIHIHNETIMRYSHLRIARSLESA